MVKGGCVALLLLTAEFGFVLQLRDLSMKEYFTTFDPVSETPFFVMRGMDQWTSAPGATEIVFLSPSEATAGYDVQQRNANRILREYREKMAVFVPFTK